MDRPEASRAPEAMDAGHLYDACHYGRQDKIQGYLDAGYDPNATTSDRRIAWFASIYAKRLEVVKQFAGCKRTNLDMICPADPSVFAQGGHTALSFAALHGGLDMVRTVVGGGADPSIVVRDGKTAIQWVREKMQRGWVEVEAVLEKAEAAHVAEKAAAEKAAAEKAAAEKAAAELAAAAQKIVAGLQDVLVVLDDIHSHEQDVLEFPAHTRLCIDALRHLRGVTLPDPVATLTEKMAQAATKAKESLDAHQTTLHTQQGAPDDAQLAARDDARQQFVQAADALSKHLAEGGDASRRANAVGEVAITLRRGLAALREHDAASSRATPAPDEGTEPEPEFEPQPEPEPEPEPELEASIAGTVDSALREIEGWQQRFSSAAVQDKTDATLRAMADSITARVKQGSTGTADQRTTASAAVVARCKTAWEAIETERVYWADTDPLKAFPYGQLRTSVERLLQTFDAEVAAVAKAQHVADTLVSVADRYRPWLQTRRPGIEELTKAYTSLRQANRQLKHAQVDFDHATQDTLARTTTDSGPNEEVKARAELIEARSAYRAMSKDVSRILSELASLSVEQFPELPKLHPTAGINDFQAMKGLVTPGLCLESYANVTKLDVVSRNDVYTATLDEDPCILKSYDLTNQADRRRVEREVLRLHELRHRHIVAVDAVFVESNMKAYVQMPEYKGGSLRQWLLAGAPDSQKRQRLIYGLLQAVERIHACGVTHNDMKLENVLLTEGAEDAVHSDFELSHTSGGATTTIVGGTPAYMAPEREPPRNAKPTTASDMYSVGVMLLLAFAPELIETVESRRTPVNDALQSIAALLDHDYPGLHPLLRQLLSSTPSDRCTIVELLEHSIFREMSTPTYWTAMTTAGGLEAVRLREGGINDATLEALKQALVTADPAQLGIGADATQWPDIPPAQRCLELAAAWRVQHPTMWGRYSAAVDQAYSDVRRGPPLPPVGIRSELVSAVERLPGQLRSVAINEHFLISGVPATTVCAVLSNGMNERFSGANAGTMFGEGSYLAEDAGKCDQYTGLPDPSYKDAAELHPLHDLLYESNQDHPGDVCYLLVCRVVLGYALRTQQQKSHGPRGLGTAMDRDATDDGTVFATRRHKELKPVPGSEPPLHHHSLLVELGVRIRRYREFVIFHGDQIYPEYVIAYKRARKRV